jgi:hypothetical protein
MKTKLIAVLALIMFFSNCKKDDSESVDTTTLSKSDFYGAWLSTDDSATTHVSKLFIFIEKNNWYTDIGDTDVLLIYNITATDTTLLYNDRFTISNGYIKTYATSTTGEGIIYKNEITNFSSNQFTIITSNTEGTKRTFHKTTTTIKSIPTGESYEGVYFGGSGGYWENLQFYPVEGLGRIHQILFDGETPVYIGANAYSKNGELTQLTVADEDIYGIENRGAAVINGDVYVAAMVTTQSNYLYGYWKNGVWKQFEESTIVFDACTDGAHFYCCGIHSVNHKSRACYWIDSVLYDLSPPENSTSTVSMAYGMAFINGDMYIVGNCSGNPANAETYQSPCVWINGTGSFVGTGYGSYIKVALLNNQVTYLSQGYYYNYGLGIISGNNRLSFSSDISSGSTMYTSMDYKDGFYYIAVSLGSSFSPNYFIRMTEDFSKYSIRPVVDGDVFCVVNSQ